MEVEILEENRALFASRPAHWEMILVVDRLDRPLREILSRVKDTPVSIPSTEVAFDDSLIVLQNAHDELVRISERLKNILEEDMVRAFGEPGKPGDPVAIVEVCQQTLTLCRNYAGIEQRVVSEPVHPRLAGVQNSIRGLTGTNIGQLLRLVEEMREAVENGRKGLLRFELDFRSDSRAASLLRAAAKPCVALTPAPSASDGSVPGCLAWVAVLLMIFVLSTIVPFWVIVGFVAVVFLFSQKR